MARHCHRQAHRHRQIPRQIPRRTGQLHVAQRQRLRIAGQLGAECHGLERRKILLQRATQRRQIGNAARHRKVQPGSGQRIGDAAVDADFRPRHRHRELHHPFAPDGAGQVTEGAGVRDHRERGPVQFGRRRDMQRCLGGRHLHRELLHGQRDCLAGFPVAIGDDTIVDPNILDRHRHRPGRTAGHRGCPGRCGRRGGLRRENPVGATLRIGLQPDIGFR